MTIEDLLIDFDEMGFAPTTLCENPDEYACEWKKQLVAEIERRKGKEALTHFENISNDTIISNLKNELKQLKQQAVKDFAEKLRKKVISLNVWEFGEIDIIDVDDIDELLKEYEE